jgi:hypothetical protein
MASLSGAGRAVAHRRLLILQRRIFRSLQAEADRLLGAPPEAIRRYQRQADADFRRRLAHAGKRELVRAIRAADVTFVADYHTFPQAQRTALRLMREAIRPGERWAIGLELAPSDAQRALDRYQAGAIGLDEFLAAVNYELEWGFPWANYAPIFEWARERGVPLVALNRPRALFRTSASLRLARGDSELQERDQWAAGVLTDLFADRKGRGRLRVIALYGELHVASAHLPYQLARVSRAFLGKPLRSVSVHQNQDRIYWELAREGREGGANVLRLPKGGVPGHSAYCVVSSTPWTKLQSLISWAEGETAPRPAPGAGPAAEARAHAAEEMEDDDSAEADHLSAMRVYGGAVAELLEIPPPAYESLSVTTIREADFVDGLRRMGFFTRSELALVRHHVETNQRIYVPRAHIAYLGSPSPNVVAELAALHLMKQKTRSDALFEPRADDFFRLVLEAAFGFFGSLVINPRRKCDLAADHAQRIAALARGGERTLREELDARRLALEVLLGERALVAGRAAALVRKLKRAMTAGPGAPAAMLAARFAGHALGERMHRALVSGELRAETVRHACLSRMDGEGRSCRERYVELLRACGTAPRAASKRDRI